MSSHLPTPKTVVAKVREAIKALDNGKYAAIAEKHVSADLDELGFTSVGDYWDAIFGFLHEIQAAGPASCYAGGRPPQRSYERGFQGLELFAYAWDSPSAQRRMYLKFGIRNETYYHLDCHEDRPKR
ncbi:hypothetical protein WJU23_23165 [Prosthecobacter sp. SYSU 5D2]|uniref:hypothetical protein n=1 Tax=Prosthecobacter sp. SYSU 5D2 TaxID=3134134 RepID=UPI0031FEE69D